MLHWAATLLSPRSPQWLFGFALATMVFVGLVAKLTSTWTLRALVNSDQNPIQVLRRYTLARRIHLALWAISTVAIIAMVFRVTQLTSWTDSVLTRLALVFSWLVAWLMSWTAFYDIERHFGSSQYDRHCRWRYVGCRARFYTGLLVMPAMIAWAWSDFTQWLATHCARPECAWWVFSSGLCVLIVVFPPLLVRVWPTSDLDDTELRDKLQRLAARHGASIRKILVWDTHGSMCNAAYTGILKRWRYVLLTDALLDRLDPWETQAAFAHELGHIRLRHASTRILWIGAPLGWWLLIDTLGTRLAAAWPATAVAIHGQLEELSPQLSRTLTFYLPLLCLAIYLVVGIRRLAIRLEIQADAWAVNCLRLEWGPSQAVRVYQSMLNKVGRGGSTRGSWTYPSLTQRHASLEVSGTDDEAGGSRFLGVVPGLMPGVAVPYIAWLLIRVF